MIAIIGDAVVDLMALGLASLPAWGEDREVRRIEQRLGGSGLHVATNLAALGNPTALLAGVGEDRWGEFLRNGAAGAGVVTRGMRALPVPSAVTMVLSGPADRAFVSTYGATAAFAPADLDWVLLEGARHVHISGIWQAPALLPHLPGVLDQLREWGITISLDTAFDASERWGEPLPALLERIDLFLPSEIEATRIARLEEPLAALDWLAARVPTVALKQGARGSTVQQGSTRHQADAFPIQIVDTTGAGDAFNAGFLHAWLHGWEVPRALRLANATGALAVARVGASEGAPTLGAVQAFIAGVGG